MNNHKYIALFFFLLVLPSLSQAITCEPAGAVEQTCREIKDVPYNTTAPEIRVQFFESGVVKTNPILYRIGDIGTPYPEDIMKIEDSYYPIAVHTISSDVYVPDTFVADGIYMFRVDAMNLPKNKKNIAVFFTINNSGMKFWVTSPLNGLVGATDKPNFAVSNNSKFNLRLTAERPVSICKYSPIDVISTAADIEQAFDIMLYSFTTDNGSISQSKSFYTEFDMAIIYPNYREGSIYYPLSIICQEPNERFSYSAIYVGYDNSAPVITARASPNPVIDAGTAATELTIQTNDRSACRIIKRPSPQETAYDLNGKPIIERDNNYDFTKADEFVTDYKEQLVYSGSLNNHTYNYTIVCTNLAGLNSSLNYSIRVEMTTAQSFTFTSPGEYINGSALIVNGTAVLGGATICTASLNKTGPYTKLTQELAFAGNIYSGTLSANLPEGKRTVYVNCTFMHDYFSEKTFTVDRTPPTSPNISAGDNSCSLDEITATIKSTDNTSGIKKYYYNLTADAIDESIQLTSNNGRISYSIDGEISEGETYVLKAWAEDKAGNKGGVSTKNIKITNSTILSCDEIPPRIIVNETRSNGTNAWTIRINCTDQESGCKNTFKYGTETNGSKTCNTTQTVNLMTPVTIQSTAVFCATVYDNNNNERNYEKLMLVNYPLTCSDGRLNGKESDVDCGGDCPKCALNKSCSIDIDCTANYCKTKKCSIPACTDSIKNGNESGIDCGGNCIGCENGFTCVVDKDCKSSNCINNKCAEANCTNSKKDGTESDVDCGGTCNSCLRGDMCNILSDCSTKYCDASTKLCQINPTLDSDGDKLADVWEEKYCGSFTGCDPKGDIDGDRYTNLEEFIANTNPTDETSFPDYKKYNIFAIIFLCLGALMIISGGVIKVGEISEQQKFEKIKEEKEIRTTLGQIPKMNSVMPSESTPIMRELTEEEKIRGQQARLKALKSRDAERRKVINQFDVDDEKSAQSKSEKIKPLPVFEVQKPKEVQKKAVAETGEEYVNLAEIKKTKNDDVFSKLKNISNTKETLTSKQNPVQNKTQAPVQQKIAKPSHDEVFEKLKKMTKEKKTTKA